MELSPNSRFQIIPAPVAHPGKCTLCGSSNSEDREYIDFGFQLDVYGAIYFCTFCVSELAEAIGFKRPDPFWEQISHMETEGLSKQTQLDEALEQAHAARVLLRNCHCSDPDSGFSCTPPVSVDSEGESPIDGDSGDDDESSSVEGSDDIPESSDDDEPVKRSRKRTAPSDE